jgi:glycerol-1-phosphate dehydrogenase [NAD(P)+]
MQSLRSSRPASGAEHQFSHLWDMQHHVYNGAAPSHGFKVGIGMLASLALYDELLATDLESLDVDRAAANWPSPEEVDKEIAALFGEGDLAEKAREESRAKHPRPEELRAQLIVLRQRWPALRERLRRHLIPFGEAQAMLREAGCPWEPEQIGISRDRLRISFRQAYHIRRRFTVLDAVRRAGMTEEVLARLFGRGGRWPAEGAVS